MTEQPAVHLDELLSADAEEDEDTTANLAVFPDNGPKSGIWVDVDEILAAPTEEELEAGRRLGEDIDVDDDDDVGTQ